MIPKQSIGFRLAAFVLGIAAGNGTTIQACRSLVIMAVLRALSVSLLLLLGNCQEEKTTTENLIQPREMLTLSAEDRPAMTLIGRAAEFKESWTAMAQLRDLMQYAEHTPAIIEEIIAAVDKLEETLPEELKNDRVISRINVVVTKAHAYQVYFARPKLSDELLREHLNEFVASYDFLVLQLNENFQIMDYRDRAQAPGSINREERDDYLPIEDTIRQLPAGTIIQMPAGGN